jgi:aspartate-semialdehyde dehydrogenase
MSTLKNVAIVGATGAVGAEMIRCLEQRQFPVGQLTLLASARSAGKKLKFKGEDITIKELTPDSAFQGIDIALFSAGGGISRDFAPHAVKGGAVVVDNSSYFRQDPNTPLVVPEINAADVKNHKGIIANPNCTTAISLMALYPLHQAFGVKRIFASSYQAVSGTGAQAIEELANQSREWASQNRAWDAAKLDSKPTRLSTSDRLQRHPAGRFVPRQRLHEGRDEDGERRPQDHASPDKFRASVTCVRIPVFRAHSIAISAEFEKPVTVEAAREVLSKAPGLDIHRRSCEQAVYPLALDIAGRDNCAVGRLRHGLRPRQRPGLLGRR